MRTERVLVGIDAEEASQTAVDWVIQRARDRELVVTLVTSGDLLTGDPAEDDARLARTADRIRQSAPGVEVTTTVTDRSIVEGLVELSASFDLLVLGAHPHHPVRSALTGSLPFRVASRARCMTVIVPSDWRQSSGPVVVGVGDDATANRALLFAALNATEADCELEVLHAWQLPAVTDTLVGVPLSPTDLRRAHRELLSAAMERVRAAFPSVRVRGYLHEGPPADRIVPHADRASLVVLGTHRRGTVMAAVLGSTVRSVLNNGHAPVCVVPPAQPIST
ncbi:universal stress protein [Leifsonia sp. H3M29-4]|uniref:universal stress protein n=1 Tax=Salinibacterium metalliresistens TaxID=3031321 RepID=UPI0023DB7539|nr:universal stress protein [Salinibacterium metalliresistens]MDF1477529.1 universal stress protein [Salinibacterium metalliresistens]